MKKVLLMSVALGSVLVGCSHGEKPNIEDLQETIKEQEQYIAELEQYKQEKENFERQARQMQKQLDYEKYYMALSDIIVISKNLDDSTSFHFDYGEEHSMTLSGELSHYISELDQYEKTIYGFSVPYNKIKSGNTFKMSEMDLEYFLIYGDYEEITISEN